MDSRDGVVNLLDYKSRKETVVDQTQADLVAKLEELLAEARAGTLCGAVIGVDSDKGAHVGYYGKMDRADVLWLIEAMKRKLIP